MRTAAEKILPKKIYSYTVLFEPAEEGGYVVTCPALPGLVTEGNTLKQARSMAKDAIELYLESLRQDGIRIPDDESVETQAPRP